MRVLMVTSAEKSLFLYLAAMAWAMRTAGHDVRVASQPRFSGTVNQAGLTAVPVGFDLDPWEEAREIPGLIESVRPGLPPPYDVLDDPGSVTWDRALEGQHLGAETAEEQNSPVIDDLVAFARHWRPDLVLWEPFALAGPIAAKACGAAHARILFSVDVFTPTRELFLRLRAAHGHTADPLGEWFARYGGKYGFDVTDDMFHGQVTIDQLPASLSPPAGVPLLRTQFIPYGGAAVVPRWLWDPPSRPRVALTMGLTATEIFDGYTIPVGDVLEALSELDVEVIATVAEQRQQALGPLPRNVRLVSYVPWHALVPTCSVVVHHAGAATLATTARHPVPHLALHYHFDQPILGRALAVHGAGLAMHTSEVTGAAVRDSVRRLLTEPTFAERAAALRDEQLALPSPNEIVPLLEALTR